MIRNKLYRVCKRGSQKRCQGKLRAVEQLEGRYLLAGDVLSGEPMAPDTSELRVTPSGGPGGENLGDIDGDLQRDVTDLELLQGGIREGDADPMLDVNSDGHVDRDDTSSWLSLVGIADIGRPYVLGDADLDGDVDAGDLNSLGVHWRADEASWSHGDFTGDAAVNGLDLNALALNWRQGMIAAATTARVPRAPLPASRASLPHSVVPDDVRVDSRERIKRDDASTTTGSEVENPVGDPPQFFTPADPYRGLPIDKNPAADDEWMFLELVDDVLARWPDAP